MSGNCTRLADQRKSGRFRTVIHGQQPRMMWPRIMFGDKPASLSYQRPFFKVTDGASNRSAGKFSRYLFIPVQISFISVAGGGNVYRQLFGSTQAREGCRTQLCGVRRRG
jgi:hypothetical protein